MRFDDIAAFALDQSPIPHSALDMAATLLIDTLGVAAGAAEMDAGRIARSHATQFHRADTPDNAATLLFDGRTASIPGAAFALATQIDNLDAHDGYNPTKGHIGCAVVPALCALAENLPDLSAKDALSALVVAYEVAARAGIALHGSVSDYHTSGAWNALGVAALACRLRNQEAEVLRHALGIAEYHGPRSQMMREIANPTMLHDGSGMGAMVGLMAALMAEQGFKGAPALTVEAEDAALHWSDLGSDWTIERNYIKPYPICRWAHAAIDAIGGLADAHDIKATDVAAVHVRTFAEAAALFPGMPDTTSQAQYSMQFALATRLVHGRIGPEHISGDGLKNAYVSKLIDRISVSATPKHSDRFPHGRWSDVTVELLDGRKFSSGDVHARGGPEAPLSLAEIETKFHSMAGVLPQTRRDAIWAMRPCLQKPDTKFSALLGLVQQGVTHA